MKRYIAFLLHVTRGKQHYDFKARLDWLQTESTGNKTTIFNTVTRGKQHYDFKARMD